jgi:hypothetical protein
VAQESLSAKRCNKVRFESLSDFDGWLQQAETVGSRLPTFPFGLFFLPMAECGRSRVDTIRGPPLVHVLVIPNDQRIAHRGTATY